MSKEIKFQPYYVAYAKFHDLLPEVIKKRDGNNANYMSWIVNMWSLFLKEKNLSDHRKSLYQKEFEEWLNQKSVEKKVDMM